jgi:hypothetical protein
MKRPLCCWKISFYAAVNVFEQNGGKTIHFAYFMFLHFFFLGGGKTSKTNTYKIYLSHR